MAQWKRWNCRSRCVGCNAVIVSPVDSRRYRARAYVGMAIVGAAILLYLWSYFFLIKLGHPEFPAYKAVPWTAIEYWHYYGNDEYTRRWLLYTLAGAGVVTAAFVGILLAPMTRSLHGDARFAKRKEVAAAGLFGEEGLILGKWGARFLMLGGQLAALCAAPPRSGKGVGLVQPNMLNWPGSVVVLDIRKESWAATAGFRSKFSETWLFDPVAEDGRTMQWNPLDYVRDDPVLRINDLQKIANMLSPDPAEGDPFWPASCRTLFLGLSLYLFETPGLPRTFGEIVRQIMYGRGESVGEHWKNIIECRETSEQPLSQACKAALYDFIYTSGNTQSSIRKTFTAKLELWLNPLIDAATSASSVDLREIRKKRISIYVGVRPGDLNRLQLILNLFFEQLIDLNTIDMPTNTSNRDRSYQVLLMMDEFTAPGRMPIFAAAMSYLGGYNIRPFIIVQSVSQLRSTYGAEVAETIVTCCGATVAFAPKEQKHANEISESLGDLTVKQKTRSHQPMSGKAGSVNTSEAPRRLLKPQEVKEIGVKRELVFVENVKPIICEKVRYFSDKAFARRKGLPVPVMPAVGMAVPSSPGIDPVVGEIFESAEAGASRAIVPADMDKLDGLSLTDYDVDVSQVPMPEGQPISDDDMKRAFSAFLETMID